ncbi:hypothetical protein GCM10007897_36090 [Sphingobium jiangsuense]|uniref:Uncharacterized protein n=2 Tax=Sphingobium jiangsuense TaxID=870476 RepID=A0A7W6FT41_9SPHN|nr:hypothetical protein [Sphingobium jiangsuense]MBB3928739.1 hypothetical protein [Sphingobium jiangsuense]GLT02204.1 hypothetical protein GCM10007897_36090 [Sphingobium jiangsuense]
MATVSNLSRKLLGEFLSNPETIRAFENLGMNSDDMATQIEGIRNAAILTLDLSPLFENQRVVSSDGEVEFTDGGAGGTLTIGLSDTGVTTGGYGDASHVVAFAVNAKGRITGVQVHALNSDNVTEGSTHLYFTTNRAREALSQGSGINYDSGTGEIKAKPAGAFDVPTGTQNRAAYPTYTSPIISSPPTQAEVQAISDGLQAVSRTLAALISDMKDNGNLS